MTTRLGVMTYNICDGGHGRANLIRQVIASAQPDLVLLNEADDPDLVAELAHALGMTHVWGRGSGDKHIALLSRWPIQQWQVFSQRPITQSLLEAQVTSDSGLVLKIYGVHLLPYFMLLPYELARWRTVAAILGLIRTRGRAPHLVLGDFNAIATREQASLAPFPERIKRLMRWQANRIPRLALRPLRRAGYTDAFRALHRDDPGITWMPTRPTARLDYIFADPHLAAGLRACRVITEDPAERASDHFPLLAEFDLDILRVRVDTRSS